VPTPSATTDPTTLRRKIARLLIVGFRGTSIGASDDVTRALEAGLGGVILFDKDGATGGRRNIESPRQLATLTRQLRDAATVPLLIGIDQEGGRIDRLKPAYGFPPSVSHRAIGATDDPDQALQAGRTMGQTLQAAGIDLNFAPVVDLDINPTNPAVGALERSFSRDPAVVAAMADAMIRGFHEHGVRSAIKHFPGLGSATKNTDFDRVDVTGTWSRIELEPYATLFGLGSPDMVMAAHIVERTLDPIVPASLSSAVITGLLRGELGWDGVVVTDSMGAVAIATVYARQEAAALALEAGNDLLLYANNGNGFRADLAQVLIEEIAALVDLGRISEARLDQSIARLDRMLERQR
jgi:beta-N-acetylhexosaminidase